MSGGPIFRYYNGICYAIGIHKGATYGGYDIGIVLVPSFLDKINIWK